MKQVDQFAQKRGALSRSNDPIRKIYYLLFLLLCAGRAEATVSLVQHRGVTYSHVSANVVQTLAYSTNTTAGNTLIVSCGEFDNGGGFIPVMRDGLGNHFAQVTYARDNSTFAHAVSVFPNIAGGATTIGCLGVNSTFYTIIIAEYSGVDTRYPVDVFNQAYSASGSSKSAGAITTNRANEVLCAFYYDDHIPGGVNYTATIGSGFTIQEQSSTFGSNTQGGFADKVVSSIQTGLNPAWLDGTWTTDGVTLIIVSLQEAFSTASPVFLYQHDGANASGSSVTKAYPGPQVAGNMNLILCYGAQASAPTLSLGDSQSGIYTTINTLNNGIETVIWGYRKNISGGANSVTCSSSLTGTGLTVLILEYHGLSVVAPLDQHVEQLVANGGYPAAPAQPAAITTTQPKEIVVLLQSAFSPSPGFQNIGPPNYVEKAFFSGAGVTTRDLYLSDQYVTATGTFQPYSISWNQTSFFQMSASFIQGPTANIRHKPQVI